MQYKLWIFTTQKITEIGKNSLSQVSLGLKSDDIAQLKFNLNSNNLDTNSFIINNPKVKILLEIGSFRLLFYRVKYARDSKNSYNVNLVADYRNIMYEVNPLQNQTYSGSLSGLLSQLVPNWQRNQFNGLDTTVSISVGTDDIISTIKKAMDQANWRWRISGYNQLGQPILEYGDPSIINKVRVQFNNYANISSFGDKNIISSLTATVSNEYINQLRAIGKYDSGNNPEFDLAGYVSTDSNYPVMNGAILDQAQMGLPTRTEVKKFTIPATIPPGQPARDYLYQVARSDMIATNSRLIDYRITVLTNKFIQPLEKVFIHYNRTTKNLSGLNLQRVTDTKVVSAVQYNLDTNTVALTLSSTGRFQYSDGKANILNINKTLKSLTQST